MVGGAETSPEETNAPSLTLDALVADVVERNPEPGFDQFKAALAARTRTLAYGLFAAQEQASAAKEVADRFQALREVLVPLGAVPIATYVEVQKQCLEAVEALLDTKHEALDAGQELQRLTGLDFGAVQTARPTEGKQ